MRLVTYKTNREAKLGALLDNQVADLAAASQAMGNDTASFPADMLTLLEDGTDSVAPVIDFVKNNGSDYLQPVADVTLLPPVPNARMVVALGRNYAAHAAEGGAKVPDYPMLFHKMASSMIGHGGTIVIPPITSKADYEAELAVIIGKTCKNVSEEDAWDYVAGYAAANDVSARDLQRRTSQFTAGKMLDTFGPIGPALVTPDEITDPQNLNIRTILNGEVLQDDNTSNMIFNIPFTISYISQIATLQVGDIILTGTPEGVGYPRTPPIFLKHGDSVTIDIESVGTLTNDVIEMAKV